MIKDNSVYKMQSISLEVLHPELLQRVCEYLDFNHPPSLLALAQTSKNCYAIASGLLFRAIKLTFSDGLQLVREVQEWETLLFRDGGFPHVRRLILCWSEMKRRNPYISLGSCERYEDDWELRTCWDYCPSKLPSASEGSVASQEWEVVVGLMKQMRGLADIFYACPMQFPPRLLQTLHEHIPRCRLHHYTFSLRTLYRESLDPNEMALVTSPCLHSIGGLDASNDRLEWECVRRKGHLKRAHILMAPFATDDESNDKSEAPSIPLEFLQVGKSCRSLSLLSECGLSFSMISRAAHGNFSALRTLRLGMGVTINDLNPLPAPSEFPTLVALSFICAPSPAGSPYWDMLGTFLHGLPRLTALQLKNWNRAVSLVPVLSPHLCNLDISTRATNDIDGLRHEHIHRLAELCPLLEDVAVEIQRSQGDATEVSLYRELGRLPRLQRLALNLSPSLPEPTETARLRRTNEDSIGDGTVVSPCDGDLDDPDARARTREHALSMWRRACLIKGAIGSRLARYIFEVVNTAKSKLSGSVLPIEHFEIRIFHQDDVPGSSSSRELPATSLRPYSFDTHTRWLMERNFRVEPRDSFGIIETGPTGYSSSLRITPGLASSTSKVKCLFVQLEGWQRSWPSTGKGSQWSEDWESQPLILDNEGFPNRLEPSFEPAFPKLSLPYP